MKLNGLAHIGVKVKNPDASAAFYCDVMGFKKTSEHDFPACRIVFVEQGSCILELIEKEGAHVSSDNVVAHICLEVKDIEQAVDKLAAAGVPVTREQIRSNNMFGGAKNIFFDGPDGESIELFEFLAK